MPDSQPLAPAQQLAATNTAHFPNETVEHRIARHALLVEELKLRRQIEHVAAQRRALPSEGEISRDLEFVSETGSIRLSHLFSGKDTLLISRDYTRTCVTPEDADIPGFSVFHRWDRNIRHFYSCAMNGAMADPGQDHRGAPDLDPPWLMLDSTPEGRGTAWYPKLDYGRK